MKNKKTTTAAFESYISVHPDLFSLLYDMDMLPEQLKEGSNGWYFMVGFVAGHSCFVGQNKESHLAAIAKAKECKR